MSSSMCEHNQNSCESKLQLEITARYGGPKPELLSAGTLNSIGYSLSGELLDIDGDLWHPPEDDPAETQESSAPFRITSYHPGAPPYTHLSGPVHLDMV